MITTENYYKPIQLKLPVDLERIIDINDSVYSFVEVLDHIDLKKYLVEKDYKTGRPSYDPETLLRITLFAFMEHGYISLREIEKLCKTDIRFMWLLDEMPAPSHMTIDNFINDYLKNSIEEIFTEINTYIFTTKKVDLNHAYFDGMEMALSKTIKKLLTGIRNRLIKVSHMRHNRPRQTAIRFLFRILLFRMLPTKNLSVGLLIRQRGSSERDIIV